MKICLDAGHGTGQNQSPARCGYFEGDRMFTLQRLLQQELEAYGVTVVCTRAARQDDPPLYTRALAAKDCDLFLSLHSNAAGNGVCESVDYPVVFYPVSGKGIGLAAELAECIHKTMGTLQPAQTRVRWNSAHNADYYGVIRFTAAFGVTGMILEHSFHTNTRMTTWLLDDENLKRLAAAEAAVLAEHYGLKKTAGEPQRAETVRYHLLSDVPQGDYRTVLDKLIAADILRGRSGTGEERVLDLTEDSVRLLVLLDRAGAFGSLQRAKAAVKSETENRKKAEETAWIGSWNSCGPIARGTSRRRRTARSCCGGSGRGRTCGRGRTARPT